MVWLVTGAVPAASVNNVLREFYGNIPNTGIAFRPSYRVRHMPQHLASAKW